MAETSNAEKQPHNSYWKLGEEEEEKACSSALFHITDNLKFPLLKTVIDLGVFDIIKKSGGRLSAAEIASALPTNNTAEAATVLERLLDFLVCHSILTVASTTLPGGSVERRYGLAPVCKFLTPDDEDGVSLTPFANVTLYKALVKSALRLKEKVIEGADPFKKAHGMSFYEYSGKHPEHQQGFHEAMSHHSTLVLHKLLHTYHGFAGLSSLVDVGGGNGATLNMIVSRYPSLQGINFDQPHVIADAPSYPGVEHQAGDMFVSIPKGDAIFLKWICHCFSDEDCIRILKNCYAALPEEKGKVIICEFLLPNANETNTNNADTSVVHFDMMMMVMLGGKERREKEFKALAMAAGFQGFQVVCSVYNVKIIELLKKL